MITISLIGKEVALSNDINLYDFLREKFSFEMSFAVALNGEFVSKSEYKHIGINPGDEIEVVSAHPGG